MISGRVTAAAVAMALSTTAGADDWKFTVTPYLWATDVGINLTIADQELVDAVIPFEDLLGDLKVVAQARAEAMRGEHGISLDLFTVRLADDNDVYTIPGGPGGTLTLDSETGMTILDVAGVYDADGDGFGLSLLYGTRIINQTSDIDAEYAPGSGATTMASYDANDTFVDALLGLRYVDQLPGNWHYEVAADLSAGDTDFTWSVAPSVGYTFGARDQYALTAGYRHMVIDFETHPPTDMDMTLKGFLLGFRITF